MTIKAPEQQQSEVVNHQQLMTDLYPISNHPLYGNVLKFAQTPYLMPATLADFTNDTDFSAEATSLEICPACFFNTSGTTNRSKKIPFSDADLERQKIHEAIALRKLGMGEGDGVMSLGAPLPSISGWAIVNGSEATGARALNSSQIDYEEIIEKGLGEQVTFVIGTPLVVKEIGKAIEMEFGPLREVLPNLKTGIIFGDVLPDALRAELKELWGFDNVYSLYGTVEADVVATECVDKPGEMNLMSERLYFEFIPESELAKERQDASYVGQAKPVSQAYNGEFGEIIISDLSRDTLPLIRYRIGDIIQIHRATAAYNIETPTVSVLGRSKNTVLVCGIALYEMQLNRAIQQWLGDEVVDWKLTQNASQYKYSYTLQVQTKNIELNKRDALSLYINLSKQRDELQQVDLTQQIEVEQVKAFEQVEVKGDTKAQRIVLL
ncbi:phenylacetate--CoA ligase family protein [Catenovulum sp. SX2]|uniref:phenylacetate--CoA ligase family protein n=1 Tax=Catenovulum sp. SX2 TaxID=3398614 RepID=UPI003F82DAAE